MDRETTEEKFARMLHIEEKFEELQLESTIVELISGDRFSHAFYSFYSWEKLRDRLYSISMPIDESAYLHLTDLLYTLEGPMSFVMNAVIYTLVRDGHHDIWSEQKQKFISSFDEVFNIPLSTRIKFLNTHGFNFFSEICPRGIRNAVAHQNFTIESDGSIHFKGTRLTLSELDRINNRMMDVVETFMNVLGEV